MYGTYLNNLISAGPWGLTNDAVTNQLVSETGSVLIT